jgi:2-dehydropantoate 2-reductase
MSSHNDGFEVKTNNNHWYIVGAGAIGCLWAYALKKAGQDVSFVVKEHTQDSGIKSGPQQRRLLMLDINGDKSNHSIDVDIVKPSTLADNKTVIEHSIIATKAYDANAALQSIVPALSLSATVLSLCNGMGMHKTMHQQLQKHSDQIQFLLGVTSDGALLHEPFKLSHTGIGHTFIGHYFKQEQTNTFLPPHFYLQHSLVDNIHSSLWQKMLINCVINPLTAIYQCKNGELFSSAEYSDQIKALCDELSVIANNVAKPNINMTAEALFKASETVANQTAQNTSSMLKDGQLGRPLELDYLNGYIVKLAQENGLASPVNQQLLGILSRTRL